MSNPTISIHHDFPSPDLSSFSNNPKPTSSLPPPPISISHSSPTIPSHTPPRSPTHPPLPPRKKDRSALRHFYGLTTNSNNSSNKPFASPVPTPSEEPSELDKPSFDPKKYISDLCAKGDLRELLKVENDLLNDIRGFDGERKALVYDNYSKLIAATDTIKKMRSNMEPLSPTTSTLEPAVAHIAEVSAALVAMIQTTNAAIAYNRNPISRNSSLENKKETVRWVLDAPRRIESMLQKGKEEEAKKEWEGEILPMLEKWKARGAKGVDVLREHGERAFAGKANGE